MQHTKQLSSTACAALRYFPLHPVFHVLKTCGYSRPGSGVWGGVMDVGNILCQVWGTWQLASPRPPVWGGCSLSMVSVPSSSCDSCPGGFTQPQEAEDFLRHGYRPGLAQHAGAGRLGRSGDCRRRTLWCRKSGPSLGHLLTWPFLGQERTETRERVPPPRPQSR